MSDVGLILLAAGGSSRMGRPKQLLAYQGVSLLRRAVDTALASGCSPVVVVIGAVADQVARELSDLPAVILQPNPHWEKGMGTSIRAGLHRLRQERPELSAVVIMLCDQPHLEAAHLRQLCHLHLAGGKGIVASEYAGTLGPPCLFAARWFDALQNLGDAEGARRLIQSAPEDRAAAPAPHASVDVDTPDDYERLCQSRATD